MSNACNDKYRLPNLKDWGVTAIFNTLIAGLLTYIFQDDPFWVYFIISQCIGLSICTLCRMSLMLLQPQSIVTIIAVLTVAIITGGLFGGLLGGWLAGIKMADFPETKVYTIRIVVLSLLFGGVISFYFFTREKLSETQRLLQQERIQRLTSEKHTVQSQLKMLQAQIEPHFLFNTLSNIMSLLDTDMTKGKMMLKDLTRYLRASLTESRSASSTLGSELELVAAYLNIFKVRMGDRLNVEIKVQESLKPATIAPMLIQPLVENAIKHGIDTQLNGGTIRITTEQENSTLRVIVTDTGSGLDTNQSQGLGLANIRERLAALYGKEGRLVLTENQPAGVKAVIEVPYASKV